MKMDGDETDDSGLKPERKCVEFDDDGCNSQYGVFRSEGRHDDYENCNYGDGDDVNRDHRYGDYDDVIKSEGSYEDDDVRSGSCYVGYRDAENEMGELRAQLEQKDRDLMLAAELGKALLEKNAELERKIDQNSEGFTQRVEELEQERYGLHLKLDRLTGEYENTVKELQCDITQLREELTRNRHEAEADERQRRDNLQSLAQQNDRLQEELQQAHTRERHLEAELHSTRDGRIATLSTKQTNQIEKLQDQVSELSDRKSELERHLERSHEEKETLVALLEETRDKVKLLEKHKTEQQQQLEEKDVEIRELHEQISQLTSQLDQLTEKASNSSGHSMTLYNELSQLQCGPGGPGSNDIVMSGDSPLNPYPPSMFGDDDFECDDDDVEFMTSQFPSTNQEQHHQYRERNREANTTATSTVAGDILAAYRELKQICRDIREQMADRVDDVSEDDITSSMTSSDSESLSGVVTELKTTIHSAIQRANQTQSNHLCEIQALQTRVGELEHNLSECNTSLDKIRDQLHIRDLHLQQKTYKVTELSRQVTSQQEDIKILSNQRDKLQDMLAGDTIKPQMYSAMALLRHARRERDAAVDRRYNMEKELQQSKYEIIVLNHQLMEAIQQKNKVSSLLDQWQSDMANLLGVKMEAGFKLPTPPSANSSTASNDT